MTLALCLQGKLYYVMEYAQGGDMSQLLQAKIFSERMASFYAAELTLAVEFLHKCGIVHR
jgi:serine/threonine protein kinase